MNDSIVSKVTNFNLEIVKKKYKQTYLVSDKDADQHEKELKRYLIICGLNPDEKVAMCDNNIDNLWHTFILFTRLYSSFCNEIFGHFIHHLPNMETSNKEADNDAITTFCRLYAETFGETPSENNWKGVSNCMTRDCNSCNPCATERCQSGPKDVVVY